MTQKRIICFLGSQGSGKGTQAKLLAKELGLPHVSTGGLYRAHIKQETSIGLEAEEYIKRGILAPDSLTNRLITETLDESMYVSGIIIDGFPRTIVQKEFLDEEVEAYEIVYVDISEEVAAKRIFGRRQCEDGHIYHIEFNPPKEKGVCDIDQLPLTKRKDDTEELLVQRLKAFKEKTKPFLDIYKENRNLHIVDGGQSIEAVQKEIREKLV